MMDRSPNASLSPREVNVLRALKQDRRRLLASDDRKLLLSMRLLVSDGEALSLSPAGNARLEREERAKP